MKMAVDLNDVDICRLSDRVYQKRIHSITRIQEVVKVHGKDQVYVAVSGGKDSIAVVSLMKEAMGDYSLTLIHNRHDGENVTHVPWPMLIINAPKYDVVPEFLDRVDLTCQIDGARRDEDKMVHYNGVEIHRSKMPGDYTADGVWGLSVLFVLVDWTEADVYKYLKWKELPMPAAS
jgi:3'-phosphoadenosine 5'-phosphosulfate sulfotransferase (PAPS reductase)/FAD synthetase